MRGSTPKTPETPETSAGEKISHWKLTGLWQLDAVRLFTPSFSKVNRFVAGKFSACAFIEAIQEQLPLQANVTFEHQLQEKMRLQKTISQKQAEVPQKFPLEEHGRSASCELLSHPSFCLDLQILMKNECRVHEQSQKLGLVEL